MLMWYKSNSCIDLFLTNQKCSFMKSSTFENGLSHFHKFITAILRKTIPKGKSYKSFDQGNFENLSQPQLAAVTPYFKTFS